MKDTEKTEIPLHVAEKLSSHGISPDEVDFFTTTDLSPDGIRCENYIAITQELIVQLWGVSGLVPKTRGKRKNRLEKSLTELGCRELNRRDYTSFSYDEEVASAALVGVGTDGTYHVISRSSNTFKDSLGAVSEHLGGDMPDKSHRDGPRHDDRIPRGGPGMPPPGGPGAPPPKDGADSDPLHCPKCGRRYADPHRRVCLHCMDKGRVIRRIMSLAARYRGKMIAAVAVLLMTGALSILTPYISSGFYYDQVLDRAGKFYGQLLLVLSLIVGTKILSMGVNILSSVISSKVSSSIQFDLKNIIFSSIQRLSLRFFTDKETGALMTQVTRDAYTIYWLFASGIPYYLVNIVQIAAILIIMFIMNRYLAFAYILTVPLIFIFMRRLFVKMGKYHGRRFTSARRLNSLLSDTLMGMRVVKAFSREQDGSERFSRVNGAEAEATRRTHRFGSFNFPIVDFLMNTSQLLVLGIGGWMVAKGELTYGVLLTFTSYMAMVYSPMFQFVRMSFQATDALSAMNRLVEIMDAESDTPEPDSPEPHSDIAGDIEFKGVTFGYDRNRPVLRDISFAVPHGTILGIVGHTGSGKSTLANLLMRMYDPDRGEITLDGIPLRKLSSADLRRSMAIVSQETYLFRGSILDNIRYAAPDAGFDEIIRASKVSGAHDFIVKLPDGYDTLIGFGGRELSGGERQRLSIARAILKEPSILILDEATAAMDTQTERNIQNALEILVRGKTTLMIAHRLSTLRSADSLIVLEDGQITERGTHDELIRRRGEYYKLYSLQLAAMKNIGIDE